MGSIVCIIVIVLWLPISWYSYNAMSDIFSKSTRSRIMKAVRSTGNVSTELALLNILRKCKFTGWRRGYRLYGKPDFVFPKKRLAIFADGCFWHGHNCRNTIPKYNKAFWNKKITRNKERDKEVARFLRNRGWKVFRVWECQIKKRKLPMRLYKLLTS